MEPLRELRVPLQLSVRVFGVDSTGKPFSQTARTVNISGNGARLEGVSVPKQVGDVIGVQHCNEKGRFRVVWIGEKDTAEEGQFAITRVDEGKCIWGEAAQDAGADLGLGPGVPPVKPPPSTPAGTVQAERRRYPRYQCIGKLLLRKEGADNFTSAKLTDLGLGGCYAETFSPLPLQSPIELVIHAADLEINARGIVRTVHPSMGNGIAFTQLTADDWRRLNQLIARVSNPVHQEAPLQTKQNVTPDSPALQALLLLLEKKGILTQDEFLSELKMVIEPRSAK